MKTTRGLSLAFVDTTETMKRRASSSIAFNFESLSRLHICLGLRYDKDIHIFYFFITKGDSFDMLQRPVSEEYSPFFTGYISQVPEGDYLSFLHSQLDAVIALFSPINDEQGLYRYEPGKWSLKEVLGHMTDTERVMSYRMLRIARGDTTNLPGFDQDLFITNTNFDELSMEDLLNDFQAVRQATFTLLNTISEAAWSRKGIANSNEISARALAYVIAGHAQHHLGIIQQKYN